MTPRLIGSCREIRRGATSLQAACSGERKGAKRTFATGTNYPQMRVAVTIFFVAGQERGNE
jgi:hypothetical protein